MAGSAMYCFAHMASLTTRPVSLLFYRFTIEYCPQSISTNNSSSFFFFNYRKVILGNASFSTTNHTTFFKTKHKIEFLLSVTKCGINECF